MNGPYRVLSLVELQERDARILKLTEKERDQRQWLAGAPTMAHGRWRKQFEIAWATLIAADPAGDAEFFAATARRLADAAFAQTEPLFQEARLKSDRIFYDGETP